jgi:hypothetical protein
MWYLFKTAELTGYPLFALPPVVLSYRERGIPGLISEKSSEVNNNTKMTMTSDCKANKRLRTFFDAFHRLNEDRGLPKCKRSVG